MGRTTRPYRSATGSYPVASIVPAGTVPLTGSARTVALPGASSETAVRATSVGSIAFGNEKSVFVAAWTYPPFGCTPPRRMIPRDAFGSTVPPPSVPVLPPSAPGGDVGGGFTAELESSEPELPHARKRAETRAQSAGF